MEYYIFLWVHLDWISFWQKLYSGSLLWNMGITLLIITGGLIGYLQNWPWPWLFLSPPHLSSAHPSILFSGKYYLQFVHSQKCSESKMRQVRLMCLHINQQYRNNVLDWSWHLICLMDTCITMWQLIQGEYKMKVAVSLLTLMVLTAGLRTVGL